MKFDLHTIKRLEKVSPVRNLMCKMPNFYILVIAHHPQAIQLHLPKGIEFI
jgi:hypothetical protein